MDLTVKTLDGSEAGKQSLSDGIFGLEPRQDILQRMVRWQLSRRQQGTHKALGRSEIDRTGAKMYRQKGTGRARHSTSKAPQFRGGGKAHGPDPRSHAHDLPKKVRALALKHALSAKARGGGLVIVDELKSADGKTKETAKSLQKLGLADALIIGGAEIDEGFRQSARNIAKIDVLPVQGINVYDILRRDTLVLSKAAVEALEERFQ